MRTKYFLFVHHTTSILAKLSIWCFEHFGDISCSLLVTCANVSQLFHDNDFLVIVKVMIVPVEMFESWYCTGIFDIFSVVIEPNVEQCF